MIECGWKAAMRKKTRGCWSTVPEHELSVCQVAKKPMPYWLYQQNCGQKNQTSDFTFYFTLMRLHLESYVQFWALYYKSDIELSPEKGNKTGKESGGQIL